MNDTYLTTDQLAERIHYDARTIRTRLKDVVLLEGVHYIRPFGGRKQQSRQRYRRRQEAALGAYLPERHPVEVQQQEAGVAAVQQAETVAAALDLEVRPGAPVDHHHRAEELGGPDRRDVAGPPVAREVWREREAELLTDPDVRLGADGAFATTGAGAG